LRSHLGLCGISGRVVTLQNKGNLLLGRAGTSDPHQSEDLRRELQLWGAPPTPNIGLLLGFSHSWETLSKAQIAGKGAFGKDQASGVRIRLEGKNVAPGGLIKTYFYGRVDEKILLNAPERLRWPASINTYIEQKKDNTLSNGESKGTHLERKNKAPRE